ncbi:Verru_Chthon cassette protein B [Verrucomicrobium sp. GAS474]|uniref:hypothetical protein n=1 Tax=Verrucomicrobium sp. GAS474 TaxID=1882831 RepID=UPI00087A2F73|nr:hypothetical protein [Verrucomicrobium sp. GAS474]SDU27623.1 Verru_Chthon cassette protein B [Verrucomicrobium sp. GAS474]
MSVNVGSRHRRIGSRGFNLVELALSLGICSFCIIGIMGLLPIGLNTNRDTVAQTEAAGIVRAAVADIQTVGSSGITGRFKLKVTSASSSDAAPQTLYVFPNGSYSTSLTGASGAAQYRLDVAFLKSSAVRILVTWPAPGIKTVDQWPSGQAGSYEVVTVLNP